MKGLTCPVSRAYYAKMTNGSLSEIIHTGEWDLITNKEVILYLNYYLFHFKPSVVKVSDVFVKLPYL